MKPCPPYAPELAACADGRKEPTADLRAHLQHCPGCRAALEELRGLAALQTQIAVRLPNPQSQPQLDAWFLRQVADPSQESALLTPFHSLRARALTIGTALLLLAGIGLYFASQRNRESAQPRTLVKNAPMAEPKGAVNSLAPTWRELRHELVSDGRSGERPYRGMGGLAVQHRLKDAYFAAD